MTGEKQGAILRGYPAFAYSAPKTPFGPRFPCAGGRSSIERFVATKNTEGRSVVAGLAMALLERQRRAERKGAPRLPSSVCRPS